MFLLQNRIHQKPFCLSILDKEKTTKIQRKDVKYERDGDYKIILMEHHTILPLLPLVQHIFAVSTNNNSMLVKIILQAVTIIVPDSVIPSSEPTLFSCCCSAVQSLEADKDRVPQDVYNTCTPSPLSPHPFHSYQSTPCHHLIPSHWPSPQICSPSFGPWPSFCYITPILHPTVFSQHFSTTLFSLLPAHYSHRK